MKWQTLEEIIDKRPQVKPDHLYGNHTRVCDEYQADLINLMTKAKMTAWIPAPDGIDVGSLVTLDNVKGLWEIKALYKNVKKQWCDCYTTWI